MEDYRDVMCTLTFYPTSATEFILTSNRDEAPKRSTIPPQIYEVGDSKLIFPKDEVAGGTWLGVSDKKRLVSLLNGGFEPHIRKERYRMSRGIIVTTLLTAENALAEIDHFDFSDIEPFTVVMVDWSNSLNIYELVWDGSEAHFSEKDLKPQIWSSSLLYPPKVKKKRETWFAQLLNGHGSLNGETLFNFHKTAGEGNPYSDLVMDRGFVKTKSISQIEKNNDLGTFVYEDLQTEHLKSLKF